MYKMDKRTFQGIDFRVETLPLLYLTLTEIFLQDKSLKNLLICFNFHENWILYFIELWQMIKYKQTNILILIWKWFIEKSNNLLSVNH